MVRDHGGYKLCCLGEIIKARDLGVLLGIRDNNS